MLDPVPEDETPDTLAGERLAVRVERYLFDHGWLVVGLLIIVALMLYLLNGGNPVIGV